MPQGIVYPGIIAEYPKVIAVVTIKTVIGSKPHQAVMVLVDTADGIVGKTIFDAETFNTGRLPVSLRDKEQGA
jgi:hypothetical protein